MERNSATATLNIHVHSFGRDDIQSQQPADITLKQLMHGRQKQRVDDSMHPRLLIGFVFRREEAAAAMSKRTTGLCAERGVLAIPILSLERDPHSSSFSTAFYRGLCSSSLSRLDLVLLFSLSRWILCMYSTSSISRYL